MNEEPVAVTGAPQDLRPGQMTAVMRATARNRGPRVLRIGLVQGGRVLEERLLAHRTSVTVGASEKAMFVIPSALVPAQHELFARVGGQYYLQLTEGMGGRVALDTGVADVQALKRQAERAGSVYRVRLTEEARGRIVIGETTFLFQFVTPPPAQPRPRLPLAVLGALETQIDWSLTVVAAFSFLVHFGLIGGMYSDWMDPVVRDEANVQMLVDLTRTLPRPVVEDAPTAAAADAPDRTPPAEKPAAPTSAKAATTKATAGPKTDDARAKTMAARADALEVGVLASFLGKSAVQGALDRSNVVSVDLTEAARSAEGTAASRSDGLKLGGGGQLVQPGRADGLRGIGGAVGTGVESGAGKGAPAPQGPKGEARIDRPVSSESIGAERVVKGLHAKFKLCYNQGLALEPGMSGSVTIVAKVSPNGEVSAADTSGNTGLSDLVVKCLSRVMRNAQFDPSPSGSSLQVPAKFVKASP